MSVIKISHSIKNSIDMVWTEHSGAEQNFATSQLKIWAISDKLMLEIANLKSSMHS